MKLIFEFEGTAEKVAAEFSEFARIIGPIVAPAMAEINRNRKDRDG